MKRVLPSPYPEGPAQYWATMRLLTAQAGGFTIADVHGRTNGPTLGTVKAYVLACARAGHITRAGERPTIKARTAMVWRVVTRSAEPPFARRAQGSRGQAQQHLWTAMRLMQVFALRDLCIGASTDEVSVKLSTARRYVERLVRAGYVSHIGRGIWRLQPSRNTGPKCPAITAAGVVDRNIAPVNLNGRAA